MATVLFVWELGGDLGHLSNLRLPIEVALKAGHRVVLAVSQAQHVETVFPGQALECLQAPYKRDPLPMGPGQSLTLGHVLAHQCFVSQQELQMYLRAWRDIYSTVRPDLVMFEHSPVALMAAFSETFFKVVVGNGFALPPPSSAQGPFGQFPGTSKDAAVLQRLKADDAKLLDVIHQAQRAVGMQPLGELDDIYAQADQQWLLTWPELDHLGPRSGALYTGSVPLAPMKPPPRFLGSGRRVFGYLNAIPSLAALFHALQQADVQALLYIRGLPQDLRKTYESGQIRFLDEVVDLQGLAGNVDWVIGQAGHSTVATFALQGVPQLLIPRHQEQYFVTLRMLGHGAAAMAYQNQKSFEKAVQAMQTHAPLRQGATALAQQMARSVSAPAQETLRQQMEEALDAAASS